MNHDDETCLSKNKKCKRTERGKDGRTQGGTLKNKLYIPS